MIATNALPLIPPTDKTMSMAQCESEISKMRAIHHQEIEKFWRAQQVGLPKSMTPALTGVKRDLYQLKQVRAPGVPMFDEPPAEDCRNAWSCAIARLEEEYRKPLASCSSAELVGIVSNDDEILLIHRVEGDRLYGESGDSIHLEDDGNSNQFMHVWNYEPDRSEGGAYCVPSLYIIGSVKEDRDEWMPKILSNGERFEIEAKVEAMESLLKYNALPKNCYGTMLPAFLSGVESTLVELEILRTWLSEKGSPVKEERDAVNIAVAGLKSELDAKRAEVQALEKQLMELKGSLEVVRVSAFLEFHGLELGQTVCSPDGTLTGVLALNRRSELSIEVDGESTYTSDCKIKSEIRRGEWLVADESRQTERQHI